MTILLAIKNLFLDFLFPKKPEILHLESLSSEELRNLLPQAEYSNQDDLFLFDYRDETVQELIWEVKYGGNRKLIEILGKILYRELTSLIPEKALLIPLPMSDKRRFERGWNQTELLAEALLKEDVAKRFTYLPHALKKIRHTESQTKTENKTERLENLKESMKLSSSLPEERACVVLLDDVSTTGATFTEAKRALHERRVSRILCVSLAH